MANRLAKTLAKAPESRFISGRCAALFLSQTFFLIYQPLCAEGGKKKKRRLLMESSLLLWMESRLLWCILATALSAWFKNTSRRFVPAEGFWSRAVQMILTSNVFQTVVRGLFHAFLPVNPASKFDAYKILTMSLLFSGSFVPLPPSKCCLTCGRFEQIFCNISG